MQLSFSEPEFADPGTLLRSARTATQPTRLRCILRLTMNLATGEVKQQTLFMGDFP